MSEAGASGVSEGGVSAASKAGAVEPEAGAVEPEAGAVEPEAGAVEPELGAVEPELGAMDPEAGAVESDVGVATPECNRDGNAVAMLEGKLTTKPGRLRIVIVLKGNTPPNIGMHCKSFITQVLTCASSGPVKERK